MLRTNIEITRLTVPIAAEKVELLGWNGLTDDDKAFIAANLQAVTEKLPERLARGLLVCMGEEHIVLATRTKSADALAGYKAKLREAMRSKRNNSAQETV